MGLRITHISKSFSHKEVLHDISLSFENGEIVGLLGPNGAGKTTLMKIILGLLCVDDKTEPAPSLNIPASRGYLPEKNPLYENMYVREYLNFIAEISLKEDRRTRHVRVENLMEIVGLNDEKKKKIGDLSKGYRQRIGLAQAIINDPELLILDEPTTGLDPNQIIGIHNLIRNLINPDKYCPKVIILSTHILQEVKEMCSRIIILDKGYVKADTPVTSAGDIDKLFAECTHE